MKLLLPWIRRTMPGGPTKPLTAGLPSWCFACRTLVRGCRPPGIIYPLSVTVSRTQSENRDYFPPSTYSPIILLILNYWMDGKNNITWSQRPCLCKCWWKLNVRYGQGVGVSWVTVLSAYHDFAILLIWFFVAFEWLVV